MVVDHWLGIACGSLSTAVRLLFLLLLLVGCGRSVVASSPQDLASRESLNAEALDNLTAAGESGGAVGFNPSVPEDRFQSRGSTLHDAAGSFPSGQLQMPSGPALTTPTVLQSNSIRQAW